MPDSKVSWKLPIYCSKNIENSTLFNLGDSGDLLVVMEDIFFRSLELQLLWPQQYTQAWFHKEHSR